MRKILQKYCSVLVFKLNVCHIYLLIFNFLSSLFNQQCEHINFLMTIQFEKREVVLVAHSLKIQKMTGLIPGDSTLKFAPIKCLKLRLWHNK